MTNILWQVWGHRAANADQQLLLILSNVCDAAAALTSLDYSVV
jgi:hypothetical protein